MNDEKYLNMIVDNVAFETLKDGKVLIGDWNRE